MSTSATIPFPTLAGTPPFRPRPSSPLSAPYSPVDRDGGVPFTPIDGISGLQQLNTTQLNSLNLNQVNTPSPGIDRSHSFRHARTRPALRPVLRTRSESIISMIDDPLTAQASEVFSASTSASPRSLPVVPSRKLYALGDIHLSFKPNRVAWEDLRPHPTDGLILVGDVGETREHCEMAFVKAKSCFQTVFWCPGNHELYTLASHKDGKRGVDKYMECVEVARANGVITPEDPYTVWDGDGGPCLIAPIFTLYDYSFKPDDVPIDKAVEWAKEHDVLATDEMLLHPDPYPTRQDWCAALVEKEEAKLTAARAEHPDLPLILINHWPLRQDLVRITLVPRFRIWCGTVKTEDWHTRFNAKVVVSGHLHVRRTDWKDGVRFEECSLGYPKQWREAKEMGKDVNDMLREILPGPEAPLDPEPPTQWRRTG